MTPDKVEAMDVGYQIARILADWKPIADGEAVADAIIMGLLRYSIATESEHEIELAKAMRKLENVQAERDAIWRLVNQPRATDEG